MLGCANSQRPTQKTDAADDCFDHAQTQLNQPLRLCNSCVRNARRSRRGPVSEREASFTLSTPIALSACAMQSKTPRTMRRAARSRAARCAIRPNLAGQKIAQSRSVKPLSDATEENSAPCGMEKKMQRPAHRRSWRRVRRGSPQQENNKPIMPLPRSAASDFERTTALPAKRVSPRKPANE